jgi:methyl-accepting chemotaxis protein
MATSLFSSIRSRLTYGTLGLALIPLVVAGAGLTYFALQASRQSLEARAYDQMQSIRAGKEEEVKAYFENVVDNMAVVSNTEEVRAALRDLPVAFDELPTTLPVTVDQARTDLAGYYRDQFGGQYQTRNPGSTVDISTMVTDLDDATIAAQYLYIASNPNPLGEKGKLDIAADGSAYSAGHARIHNLGRRTVEQLELYDFFLFDLEGDLVYTFFKELDYGTNVSSGPWAKSGLGQAFAAARSGRKQGEATITDYAPYRPSYDDQASFVSMPVFDGGVQTGVFVVQLPINRVDQIMTFRGNWSNVGLGESGEVYLVGSDKTPRSVSRFIKEDAAGFVAMMQGLNTPADKIASMRARGTNIGAMTIDTSGTQAGLAGQSGTAVYPDYRGTPVLGSYAPLDILNQRWVILSEIDESEAFASVNALQRNLLTAAAVGISLLALLAFLVGRRLSNSINTPLAHFGDVVKKVAGGDNVTRVKLPPTDEIGQLGVAFDKMLDERIATQTRIEQENEQLNNSVVEIMTSVAELAGRDLRIKVPVSEDVTGAVSDAINMMTRSTAAALGQVRRISDSVSASTTHVRQRNNQVEKVANEASEQATAAAAEIQQTATALKQMGVDATQANSQAERALKTTSDALEMVRATVTGISSSRDQIRETEKRVKRLAERSQEITGVVNIIGQIAERTSVLALNASMQAVAAGDAGRGFAVVADEVKRLAENARQATQQIGTLVTAIQSDATETIQAMNGTIAQVVDISKLADQAGGQMNDTRSATELLVASVKNIANATNAQSVSSQTLLTRAYQLLQSSQETLDELAAQRTDTESLATSAKELVSTVGEFRLPDAS